MSEYDLNVNLILEMISRIEKDSGKSLDDNTVLDAMLMRFQVIGENVDKLPKNIIEKHLEVNWKKFYKFRNSISHEYANVPVEIIVELIREMPNLKKAVSKIRVEIK